MSDDDSSRPHMDDDVSLPKATIAKIVQEALPSDFSCAKEARDVLTECCKEFVLAIASEANEICEKDAKKTMLPEHIVSALESLGFESYISEVSEVLKDHKELAKGEKARKQKRLGGSGLSEEELLRKQEELFAQSRAKYEGDLGRTETGTIPAGAENE